MKSGSPQTVSSRSTAYGCYPMILKEPSSPRYVLIDRFRGPHFFLSNFSPAPTPHRGHLFPTSEHAYMAARTTDRDAIAAILATGEPADAQRVGRAAPLVDDWERIRLGVMEEIVTAKFVHNPELAAKLAATAGAGLLEGNTWHDQFWGDCTCREDRDIPGANALGTILMTVRYHLGTSAERTT